MPRWFARRMSEHERVRALLSQYLDGQLPPERHASVRRHLDACLACQKDLEEVRMTVQLLHTMSEVRSGRSFQLTEEQVRLDRRQAFRLSPALGFATGTAVLVLAGLLLRAYFGGIVGVPTARPGQLPQPSPVAEGRSLATVVPPSGDSESGAARLDVYNFFKATPAPRATVTTSEKATAPGALGIASGGPVPTPMATVGSATAAAPAGPAGLALKFLTAAPTFRFDGITGEVKHLSTEPGKDTESVVVSYSFLSKYPGYGDRSGQMLAQVITTHQIKVTVKGQEVVAATIDDRWDEINQKYLDAGNQ